MKYDTGKSRLDLFPWDAVAVTDTYYPLPEMVEALTRWWCIKPREFRVSIPRRVLRDIGHVLGFGADKYSDRNWEKGIPFSHLFASALRHADAVLRGEIVDPESGLPHEAHFYCNLAFLAALSKRHGALWDDRPTADSELLAQYDRAYSLLRNLTGLPDRESQPSGEGEGMN